MFAAIVAAAVACAAARPRVGRELRRRYWHGERTRTIAIVVFAMLCALNLAFAFWPGSGQVQQDVGVLAVLLMLSLLTLYLFLFRRRSTASSGCLRILAVGAHPDDLEIACGGTLPKLADQGNDVHAIVMSDGDVGGNSDVRPHEAHNGAHHMGIAHIDVHHLTDTRLAQHNMEMVQLIEAKIQQFRPHVVLTHSGHDHHQDHVAVHNAVLRAARCHPTILCFESPSVTSSFNPSFFVDIEKYLNIKIEAIEQHRDQAGKPYLSGETVRGVAAFRGSQARLKHAEAFEPVRVLADTKGLFA